VRSGKTIGGLAAAGAVIGAIAGGGKGAASAGAIGDAAHLPTRAAVAAELRSLAGMIRPSE